MHAAPIYHNLSHHSGSYPQERIYQNLAGPAGPPRSILRSDSSLKRKIARKHSFQNTGPPVDQAAASAVSELLRSINFPSLSRRENYEMDVVPPRQRLTKQPSKFPTKSLTRHRSETDLLQKLDPYKLDAVLKFMEANNIDPFLQSSNPPRGLRRIQSERHLTRPPSTPRETYYNSMERIPKDKKKKKSFFPWGDDLEYGPGIVEKLKAKFSRLSGLTTRETKRRSPSLDELNNHHDYEPVRQAEQPLRRHSKSSSDILGEDARSYTVHRVIRMEPEEEQLDEPPSISTLRRRFEPSDRARSLSRSRPVSADYSSHYHNLPNDYEPPTRTVRLPPPEVEIPPPVMSPPIALSPPVLSPVRQEPVEIPAPMTVPAPPPAPPVVKENGESRRLRVLEVLNQMDSEPEFVKIGRSLRKSTAPPPDLYESPNEESPVLRRSEIIHFESSHVASKIETPKEQNYDEPMLREVPQATQDMPKMPAPRKFVIRGEAHLPTLSNNFRIIRDVPSSFNDLPPDPEQYRRPSVDYHRVTSPIQSVAHVSAPQGSPPPEEPRPSKVPEILKKEEPCRVCEEKTRKDQQPVKEQDREEEGFNEVQRLLSRFQLNRNTRGIYEISHPEETIIPSNPPPPPLTPSHDTRPFSATVVGVHNSARQATAAAGRVNVVSISVRSDAPSIISNNNNNNSPDVSPISTAVAATKRPAPSPPEVSPAPQPQPMEERRSLSSMYFEDKARRERPYGDDVTELRTELRESSVDDDEPLVPSLTDPSQLPVQDSEESTAEESETEDPYYPPRPFSLTFPEPMIAGDGNPVRHTILSLVMEEDIPQLIEAMAEKYNFFFEDLQDIPSTSSIIHPVEARKKRRIERQVTSIKFQETNPVVYTYLDEDTQITEQWSEGAYLNYEEYQKIWEDAAEEHAMSISELERWKAEVARRIAEQEDLASHSFNSITDPNTISV